MRIGKIKENALRRSVLKQIQTEFKGKTSAAVGADCAFSKSGKAFSATGVVTEDVADGGYYAVMKAANALMAQGIEPDHVNVTVLLDEECDEPKLKGIVKDCIEASQKCGVIYAGGHTEVSRALKRPVITATCIGTLEDEDKQDFLYRKPRAGDELVISKWVGMEGTAMLAGMRRSELLSRYPQPFIDDAADFKLYLSVAKEAEVAIKSGVSAVHDISSGGVFAALWEMGERAGTGLKADFKKIPIRQETIEICEFFEINPYELLSGGALLFAAADGKALVKELEAFGIPAAVIGSLTKGRDRVIINQDETRFLEMPKADEILKVLG